MDKISKEQRSRNMSAIRGRNTKPEIAVRKLLFSLGYRYRIHNEKLPGKPDVYFSKKKCAIFVNGCFWHQHPGCRKSTVPKSNQEYWVPKLRKNVERDIRAVEMLEKMGIRVLVVWECEVADYEKTGNLEFINKLISFIN